MGLTLSSQVIYMTYVHLPYPSLSILSYLHLDEFELHLLGY